MLNENPFINIFKSDMMRFAGQYGKTGALRDLKLKMPYSIEPQPRVT